MRRSLLFFIKVAVLIAAAVWLAERPGDATIVWQGREIHMQVGILLAALVGAGVVIALLWELWRLLARSPRQAARSRAESRRRKGYRALTQGMAAVAAGDAEEARRQSGRAAVLLNEPPLTLLLAAQAAQLNGDELAARKYFTAMLDRPETRFLGLRGLLTQALKNGDEQAALGYAGRAHRERPDAAWPTTTLLELQLKAGDWAGAEATIKEAVRQKSLDAARARRTRAVILAEEARLAVAAGAGSPDAVPKALEAVKLAPDLVPARALLAALLTRAGSEKQAARVIEQGWAAAPHPALAVAFAALRPDEEPMARARRFEALAALNPQHRESHLALAEAAMPAGLWGEARRHLAKVQDAEGEAPTARLCRLMAALEEAEHGDAATARRWLIGAAAATPDPAWTCSNCGSQNTEWQARCPRCGAFDRLAWQAPPRASALALTPVGTAALTAGPQPGGAAPDGAKAELEQEAGAGVDAARLVN